ncbi:MAG: isoprenyl transferase [Thiotrichaceae bacterium]
MEKKNTAIPKHIAIVMDGNGRWAKKRLLPRTLGHKKGVDSVRRTIKACDKRGVKYLTLFAFSSENWKRPQEEVTALMSLFMTALESEAKSLAKNGVKLSFIGDLAAFPDKLQQKIKQVEELTKEGKNLSMQIAANYGGRWDIVNACKQLVQKIKQGDLDDADISEETLSGLMSTHAIPDPDLYIRTGGETRVSNFLLWQLAYAEFYFTDTLWPDFDAKQLDLAIDVYSKRQRRFGKTGDQIVSENNA